MSEYEFRRAASRFSTDDLREKFNEWLDKGHFTLKGIEPEDLIGPSLAPILFLQVSCSARADWTARVGEMDQAAYDRDLNLYRTQQQIWEDGGRRGLAPRHPARDNYVRWSTDQGFQTDTFTCNSKYSGYLKDKRGAFAGTEFEDYGIVLDYLDKASDKSSNIVWQSWDKAQNDSDHDQDHEVYSTAKKLAQAVAYDRMKEKIERGPLGRYKSFSNLKMDMHVEVDSIQLLEVPFYSIVYRYEGKAYAWVTDGLHADRQFGSRPLDKKKAVKASAAAALTVLVAAAGLTFFHQPGEEATQTEPLATITDQAPLTTVPGSFPTASVPADIASEVPSSPPDQMAEAEDLSPGASAPDDTEPPPPSPEPAFTHPRDAQSTEKGIANKNGLAIAPTPTFTPAVDPYTVDECRRLTERLDQGEGRLRRLGFEAQVRNLNGLPYAQSGPIIAEALQLTRAYLQRVMRSTPNECVARGREGIQRINSMLMPLVR